MNLERKIMKKRKGQQIIEINERNIKSTPNNTLMIFYDCAEPFKKRKFLICSTHPMREISKELQIRSNKL